MPIDEGYRRMNTQSIHPTAADANVNNISPDDAQALADATVALQRANIERLAHQSRLAADEAKTRLHTPDGDYRSFAKLDRAARRAARQLRHEQDKTLKAFAKSRGWRAYIVGGSSSNWGLLSLRDDDYSRTWCELCGHACESEHAYGFKYNTGLRVTGKHGRLFAVLVHTRHSFEKVAAYAAAVRLDVEHIGWSWHGADYTAVLFTRGAS
jgi:hypothetical protein